MSKIKLKFKRDVLLYEIGSYAYVEGDVTAETGHYKHQMADVAENGNEDLTTRTMNLAHTEVLEMLYPYTKEVVKDGEEFSDDITEYDEYEIEMEVPEGLSRKSVEHLRNLIHEYIVARVLYEWMKITNLGNGNSTANWREKIEELSGKIKSAVRWRMGRIRRSQSPF